MTQTLPNTMRVLSLRAYEGAEALELTHQPIPKPSGNQLLVKMHAAPINPSDLLFNLSSELICVRNVFCVAVKGITFSVEALTPEKGFLKG